MAKVIYKLSNKTNANGKNEIHINVCVSRDIRFQIASNVFVRPSHFAVSGTSGGMSVGDIAIPRKCKLNFDEVAEASQAKNRLVEVTNKILCLCELIPKDEITKESIKKCLLYFADKPCNVISLATIREAQTIEEKQKQQKEIRHFVSLAKEYVTEKQVSESRKKAFAVFMRGVCRYEEYTKATANKDFVFAPDLLNVQDVENLRYYLRNEYQISKAHKELFADFTKAYPQECSLKHTKQELQQHGENTIIKFMKMLRAVCKWAKKKGYIHNDVTELVFIGAEKYGTPYYLTSEERNKIMNFDLSKYPYLEVQRDIFVFHCLVGCRVGDLYKLTKGNICDGMLDYVPTKTKEAENPIHPRVPLTENAKAIIKRYDDMDANGRLFPFVSEQKYNEAIKRILTLCEINRKVTIRNATTGENEIKSLCEIASSHIARRTFVGNLYSIVQDPNIIGKMSGHVENSRAFARYRNITDDILKNVIANSTLQ